MSSVRYENHSTLSTLLCFTSCFSRLIFSFNAHLIGTCVKVIRKSTNNFVPKGNSYHALFIFDSPQVEPNKHLSHPLHRLGFHHSGIPNEGDDDDNSCLMGCCAGAQQMCFNAAKVRSCY